MEFTYKLFSIVFVFMYVISTFLYCMPPNPIKLEANSYLESSIGRFFPQNWYLFAPNPVSSNQYIMVFPYDSLQINVDTVWYDITQPLIYASQQNRLTGYERVARVQLNTIRAYTGSHPSMSVWKKPCLNGDTVACNFIDSIQKIRIKNAHEYIRRLGSSFCNSSKNYSWNSFDVRIYINTSKKWSERHKIAIDSGKSLSFLDIGTFTVDSSIIPSSFYEVIR